jgi:hypothetical protein
MQNGPNTMTNRHRPKSARPFANRPKQWTSNIVRPEPSGTQNAQRSYERYLALAQTQAQAGDIVGAENYYQHAEQRCDAPRLVSRLGQPAAQLHLLRPLKSNRPPMQSATVCADISITDAAAAHLPKRNEPPLALVPKDKAHALEALQQRKSAHAAKFGMVAEHPWQAVVRNTAA